MCKGTRGGAVVNKLRGQINKTPPHFVLSFPTGSLTFVSLSQFDCLSFSVWGRMNHPSQACSSNGARESRCHLYTLKSQWGSPSLTKVSVFAGIGLLHFACIKYSWKFCILLSFTLPRVDITIIGSVSFSALAL